MLQQLVNGTAVGTVYALVALGYALVFGVMRIINLAYGETVMVGAFAGFAVTQMAGPNLPLALAGSVLGAVTVGVAVHLLAVRPLGQVSDPRSPAHLATLITTIGAALFLQNLIVRIFGAQDLAYPPLLSTRYLPIGPLLISPAQIATFATTALLMLLMWYAVMKTRWGLAVRATAENAAAAANLGIPVRRIQMEVVVLSSILAGIAGVLVGALDRGISPLMGVNYGLKGLAALIVGGIDSIPGAVLTALLLGTVEVMAVAYWSETYRDAITYAALLLVILVRPQGLLGRTVLRY